MGRWAQRRRWGSVRDVSVAGQTGVLAQNTSGADYLIGTYGDGIRYMSALPGITAGHVPTMVRFRIKRAGVAVGTVTAFMQVPPISGPFRIWFGAAVNVSTIPIGISVVEFGLVWNDAPAFLPDCIGVSVSHQDGANYCFPVAVDPLFLPWQGTMRGYSTGGMTLATADHSLWYQALGPL